MTITEKPSKSAAGRPKDPVKHMAILQSARRHFLQLGFVAARLDDIAADAGVSKLTIYSHFGNKEQLFQSVIENECCAHQLPNGDTPIGDTPAEQVLQQFGEAFMALVLDPDVVRMHRLIMSQAEDAPQISALFYEAGPAKVTRQLADRLIALAQREKLHFENPMEAAQMLLHAWKGELHFLTTLNLQPRFEPAEIKAHVSKITALFMRAFRREEMHAPQPKAASAGLPTPPAADLSATPPPADPNYRQWPWC